jgi:polyisoprenoid-binding protein YceI
VPAWQQRAAKIGHLTLYAVLFLMPIAGWLMVSASPYPSSFFNAMPLPVIPWIADLPADQKKSLEDIFKNAHGFLGNVLLALVIGHIAVAFVHAIWLKDGVLSRMLPWISRRKVQIGAAAGLLIFGVVLTPKWAHAAEWGINPQKSEVSFEASGSGYTTKGQFTIARSEVFFDPEAPQQTSISVVLDMTRFKTDSADVDATLIGADYFDPQHYPTAQFTAKSAEQVGEDRYKVKGELRLKGVAKPVEIPFDIKINAGAATVKAETKINRMDFGIGPETIAGLPIDKDVKLNLNLVALRLDN